MNTFERRLRIVDILAERKSERINNLAFELGVAEKTIRNDIFELSFSYPIDTKRGKGGCVFIQEGFSLRKRYLSDKETSLLEKLAQTLSDDEAKILKGIVKSFGRKNKGGGS